MRPRRLRRVYTLAGLAAILAGSVIGTGIAKASPDVCGSLAVSPTVGTVEQLVVEFVAGGLTPGDAGQVIAVSVIRQCPEYVPVLKRFINAYSPNAGTVRT